MCRQRVKDSRLRGCSKARLPSNLRVKCSCKTAIWGISCERYHSLHSSHIGSATSVRAHVRPPIGSPAGEAGFSCNHECSRDTNLFESYIGGVEEVAFAEELRVGI